MPPYSLITPPIAEEHLYRLTFWTRHSTKVRVDLDQDVQYSGEKTDGVENMETDLQKAKKAAEFLHEPTEWKRWVIYIYMIKMYLKVDFRWKLKAK